MRKRVIVTAALVALLVTGGLYASNMGFKLNYPLLGDASGGGTGNNTLGLPYNQQTNLVDVEDLLLDINASAGSDAVNSITRFLTDDTTEFYTGFSGTVFTLTPAEGYQVSVNADVNYIVVGSHNPSLVVNLLGSTSGGGTGNNFWSYPYHSTAALAEDLIGEIDAAAGSPVVNSITSFLADDSTLFYTGFSGDNFVLTPGAAYQINVASDVSYVPSHY